MRSILKAARRRLASEEEGWALATAIILNADTLNMVSKLWSDKTVRDAVVASAQSPSAPTDVGQVAENVGDLSSLDVPLGWDFSDGGSRDLPSGVIGWLAKIIGLLLTGAAISLGAPFWFDLLNKVVNLRATGKKPEPEKEKERK